MGKGELTRQKVLDRAIQQASLGGLESLSVGDLAKLTGMSKSGLFAHFKSKESLQLEVLKRASDLFVETVLTPAFKKPRGETRVRALFENWQVWDIEILPGGCVFAAVGAEIANLPASVRSFLTESQRDWMQAVATVARSGVDSGAFSKDLDTELFAFEFLAITRAHHAYHYNLESEDAAELSRRALEGLLDRSRA
jgi:AcrR family transcriptional regulator